MLDFALKVSQEAYAINDADFISAARAWLRRRYLGYPSAFSCLINRMANLTEMRPNDEFYLLGRLPKT